MSNRIDYSKIGFKSGLEIHQQLDTGKLFSRMPSVLRNDKPDFFVKRKLHVVAGEGGNVDAAAEYQASLDKEFIYEVHSDTTSLVELDEEPPYLLNEEALKIALQISVLLSCKIVSIAQIMRKTVIDGSNTSGFQRTVLVARDGFVETSSGKVGIETICLEEDSARKISDEKNSVVYRLDRLGIPLIEIATKPDLKNPEQVKEAALKIGEILRSCKVKRGIGAIRQDVNVSVEGHPRVEIKGFQDVKMFVPTIEKEIERQLNNVKNKKDLKPGVRKALVDGETEFLRPMPGAARMYPETDLPLLKIHLDKINDAKKNLPKVKGDLEQEFRKKGLSEELITLLFKQRKLDWFKELVEIYDDVNFVGKVLLIFPKEIATKNNILQDKIDEILHTDVLASILEYVRDKKISESDVKHVLEKIAQGIDFPDAVKIEKGDVNLIEEKIMNIIKEKPGLNANAYMGLVMKEFKGKISGEDAMKIIGKFLG